MLRDVGTRIGLIRHTRAWLVGDEPIPQLELVPFIHVSKIYAKNVAFESSICDAILPGRSPMTLNLQDCAFSDQLLQRTVLQKEPPLSVSISGSVRSIPSDAPYTAMSNCVHVCIRCTGRRAAPVIVPAHPKCADLELENVYLKDTAADDIQFVDDREEDHSHAQSIQSIRMDRVSVPSPFPHRLYTNLRKLHMLHMVRMRRRACDAMLDCVSGQCWTACDAMLDALMPPKLVDLSVTQCSVSDDTLCRCIRSNASSLNHLGFSGTVKGTLSTELRECIKLLSLTVSHSNIRDQISFAKAIPHSLLKLCVRGCALSDEFVSTIQESLTSLTELDCSDNTLSEPMAKCIASMNSITSLTAENCRLCESAQARIASMSSSLAVALLGGRTLRASRMGRGVGGGEMFDAMKSLHGNAHPRLTHLDVSNSGMYSADLSNCLHYIANCKNMKTLVLSNSMYKRSVLGSELDFERVITSIRSAIKPGSLTGLEELQVAGMHLNDEDAESMLALCIRSSSIRCIDVSHNRLGKKSADVLQAGTGNLQMVAARHAGLESFDASKPLPVPSPLVLMDLRGNRIRKNVSHIDARLLV